MQKILIISLSYIEKDPRVSRQIKSLASHFAVAVAGRGESAISGIDYIRIIPRHRNITRKIQGALLLKTKQFARYYWQLADIKDAVQKLSEKRFDLIIANDLETLPLALKIAGSAKVLLDAHEYSPKEYEENWLWRFFSKKYVNSFLCQEHLPKIDAMMTVCEGIAEEYSHNFNIPKPFIVLNAPYYQHLEPKPCEAQIRLIHHGMADPARKLELMIEMMDYLDDRFSLDFILIDNDPKYLTHLKKTSASNQRIRFRAPVNLHDIIATLNSYDIGLYILPPSNLNFSKALPNKFFEFIQGRLAIAIGPSPEMAHYVQQYDCGIVAQDFNPHNLATLLNRLTREEINQFKHNSHKASQELCFEASEEILLKHIQKLLTD